MKSTTLNRSSATAKRATVLVAVAALSFLLSACVAHVRPAPVRAVAGPGATVVKVRAGHVHTDRCGHFRDGSRWYFVRGHVHKRGCGHVHRRGVWVVRR